MVTNMTSERTAIFLKTTRFIGSFLLLSLCGGCDAASEAGDAYFPGLNSVVAVEGGCANQGSYSIKIVEGEDDQTFTIYKGKNCSKKNKLASHTLGIEANLAGIWQDFLVFDEGTDVNNHNLRLISIIKPNETFNFAFEGEPQFDKKDLTYYEPADKNATGKECKDQAEEIAEWERMEFPIFLAIKKEFSAETRAVKEFPNSYRCFGIQ
jgi:hypothetical protein